MRGKQWPDAAPPRPRSKAFISGKTLSSRRCLWQTFAEQTQEFANKTSRGTLLNQWKSPGNCDLIDRNLLKRHWSQLTIRLRTSRELCKLPSFRCPFMDVRELLWTSIAVLSSLALSALASKRHKSGDGHADVILSPPWMSMTCQNYHTIYAAQQR